MKFLSLAAAALVLVVGCGKKLNLEQTFDLPMEGKIFEIDAVSSEQKIEVKATATEQPIGVYVYLKKNEEAAERGIYRRDYTNVIAKADKTQEASVDATIPPNEMAVVRIHRAGLATKVTVQITNR